MRVSCGRSRGLNETWDVQDAVETHRRNVGEGCSTVNICETIEQLQPSDRTVTERMGSPSSLQEHKQRLTAACRDIGNFLDFKCAPLSVPNLECCADHARH